MTDPFAFQAHPDVWVLVAVLTGAYVYMVRVSGRTPSPPGSPSSPGATCSPSSGRWLMLWVASDWPIHDLGENYLYSVHMLQHMMLSYFLPPLALLATPEWLLRVLVGDGRVYGALRWLCKPVVAGVIFNLAVIITHIPGVVNASVTATARACTTRCT